MVRLARTELDHRPGGGAGRYFSESCLPSISDLDELLTRHNLEVFGPSAPKPVTMIAVQHILEHNAEVVVIPHVTATEPRAERLWQVTGSPISSPPTAAGYGCDPA